MADVEKFDGDVMMLEKHYERLLKNDNNKDIDPERSNQNYSFPMDHGKLSPREYYEKIVNDKFIYGRRSQKKIITAAAWVITAPTDIAGDDKKEYEFFKGCYEFVAKRYSNDPNKPFSNILYNAVHRDEKGRNHIHILFCPCTPISSDKLHYSTKKIAKPVRLKSGRYEYDFDFKLDENGEKIPLKNYSKMADFFDEKISCADVLNKFELQHFHADLQDYLTANNIEGTIINGATSDGNLSVKSLKEFTKTTGLTIDELKANPLSQEELKNLLSNAKLSRTDRKTIEVINQAAITKQLENTLTEKDKKISHVLSDNKKLRAKLISAESKNEELKMQLTTAEEKIKNQQRELSKALEKISALETKQHNLEKTNEQSSKEWGNTSEWGTPSNWGTKDNTKEETRSW